MLLMLSKDLLDSINMSLAEVFVIDQDIIYIQNNKKIKLFSQNLVDITLKASKTIGKSKRYHIILIIAMVDLENNF